MTKIKPFQAWRYNPEKIADFTKVIAPPYDVISPQQLKELRASSPFNVSRMDLPLEEEGLGKYEVAQKYFEKWKAGGILIQDSQSSLYVYSQSFILPDGEKRTRRGFFGRRRLEDFSEGGVKPHERTFAGPKEDRLKLTQATGANLSPVFGLFSDPQQESATLLDQLCQGDPMLEFREDDSSEHRLWKVPEGKGLSRFLNHIHDRPVLIADGHHRYETALHYRDLQRTARHGDITGEENFNYVLMFFCTIQDPGLVVLPTHRVLTERPNVEPDMTRKLLLRYGTVEEYSIFEFEKVRRRMEEQGKHGHVLGWIHDEKIELINFDEEKILQSETLNHLHLALRDLDVTLLHDLVLEEILGISKGAQRELGTIQYIKDGKEAVALAQEIKSYGFLMNATKIAQLRAVTEISETMPQKSTFFYPKLPTGLVFYELR